MSIVRSTDPVTSIRAAERVGPFIGTSQERVLWVAQRMDDFTDEELVSKFAVLADRGLIRPTSPSRIRTARKELCDGGHIEPTHTTRKTSLGHDAMVWRVVEQPPLFGGGR